MEKHIREGKPVHKMIFLDEPPRIDELRPWAADALGDAATLTQAQGDMLEVRGSLSKMGRL